MKRLAFIVAMLGTIMLLAGCSGSTDGTGGAGAPSETPTATPMESSLTSAEQVSLDFFAGAVPDLEGLFRKLQLATTATAEGVADNNQSDIDAGVVYMDAVLKQMDRLASDYNAFPAAGGRVEELEALWDAVIGDFEEMLSGMTAILQGKGTKKADDAVIAYKADMEMMKSELDALGASY